MRTLSTLSHRLLDESINQDSYDESFDDGSNKSDRSRSNSSRLDYNDRRRSRSPDSKKNYVFTKEKNDSPIPKHDKYDRYDKYDKEKFDKYDRERDYKTKERDDRRFDDENERKRSKNKWDTYSDEEKFKFKENSFDKGRKLSEKKLSREIDDREKKFYDEPSKNSRLDKFEKQREEDFHARSRKDRNDELKLDFRSEKEKRKYNEFDDYKYADTKINLKKKDDYKIDRNLDLKKRSYDSSIGSKTSLRSSLSTDKSFSPVSPRKKSYTENFDERPVRSRFNEREKSFKDDLYDFNPKKRLTDQNVKEEKYSIKDGIESISKNYVPTRRSSIGIAKDNFSVTKKYDDFSVEKKKFDEFNFDQRKLSREFESFGLNHRERNIEKNDRELNKFGSEKFDSLLKPKKKFEIDSDVSSMKSILSNKQTSFNEKPIGVSSYNQPRVKPLSLKLNLN